MRQFHCKRCKGTWKTDKVDKKRVIYLDGICADCLEKETKDYGFPTEDTR